MVAFWPKDEATLIFYFLLVNCHRGDRSQVDGLGNCCSLVENGRIIGMMGDLGVAPGVGVGGMGSRKGNSVVIYVDNGIH